MNEFYEECINNFYLGGKCITVDNFFNLRVQKELLLCLVFLKSVAMGHPTTITLLSIHRYGPSPSKPYEVQHDLHHVQSVAIFSIPARILFMSYHGFLVNL